MGRRLEGGTVICECERVGMGFGTEGEIVTSMGGRVRVRAEGKLCWLAV